jgi:hypothetical protein
MNTQRFEERLVHELKNHVQQRDQGACEAETLIPLPGRNRWARWAPAGLAAAVAAVATTYALGPFTGTDTSAGSPAVSASPAGHLLGRITTAAYTLDQEPSGAVRLTIVAPSGKANVEGLRHDLGRMGIRAKVLVGDPKCPSPHPSSSPNGTGTPAGSAATPRPASTVGTVTTGAEREVQGNPTLTLDRDEMRAGTTLVIGFPLAKTRPDLGLTVMTWEVVQGDGPACIPALDPDTIYVAPQHP